MTGNFYPLHPPFIQNLETNFDPTTGNLNWRKDRNRNLTEDFFYDEVHKNRLATWQVQGQQQYGTTYNDVNGNILTKTDFTTPGNPYTYGLNAGPHAVTGVVSPMLVPAEALQEISYNNFNKASRIMHHSQGLELVLYYGPDEQRIKTGYKINGQTTLTRYFPGGGLEVEVDANGRERWLHYLPGGGLYVCDENFDKIGMYYVLTDYLGSWDKVITEEGTPIEEYSFDPWGRRRNPTNWTYNGVQSNFTFNRGYTGHEMLDAFGLINMNGRLYDPVLGRMLSPDNYVSSAGSTQAFNRYSYALNNPLIITDPSGNNPALIAMIAYSAIVGGLSSAKNGDGFLQGFGVGVSTGALSYGVGAAISVPGTGFISGMIGNGVSAAVSGIATYGINSLVTGQHFNWKGWGLNVGMSMAMGGIYKGFDAKSKGLKFWTGRGIVELKGYIPNYQGSETGINTNEELYEYTKSNFQGSEDYVECTTIGNSNNELPSKYWVDSEGSIFTSRIENEKTVDYYIAGLAEVGHRHKASIWLSRNVVNYTGDLVPVLGHEVIHAYHGFFGFTATYGINATEYFAHRYTTLTLGNSQTYFENSMKLMYSDFFFDVRKIAPYHYGINYIYPKWVPKRISNGW